MKLKSVDLIKKLEKKINDISRESMHKSTLIYSASKEFFQAINKLGKEELKAYLSSLDKENVNATAVNFQIMSCLLVLAMGKYSKGKFLQLIHPLCTNLNNNTDLVNKIEPKRSKWRIVRWLQGILNGFKREKFVINSRHSSAIKFEAAYKALHSRSKKIDLDEYKKLSQQDVASLSLLTCTIFSIVPPQDQTGQFSNIVIEQTNTFSSKSSKEEARLISRADSVISNNFEWPPLPEASQLFIKEEETIALSSVKLPASPSLSQKREEGSKSNVADSHKKSAVITLNAVTLPALLEKPVIQAATLLKKSELTPSKTADNTDPYVNLLAGIKKIKLKKIPVSADGRNARDNPRDTVLEAIKRGGVTLKKVKKAENQKKDEANPLLASLQDVLKNRYRAIQPSLSDSISSLVSDNDESSNDEWDDNNFSPVAVPVEGRQGILSRADSGHGSYISLIDEGDNEQSLETFREKASEPKKLYGATTHLLKLKAEGKKEVEESAESIPSKVKDIVKCFNQ